jgi:hypothetical protein
MHTPTRLLAPAAALLSVAALALGLLVPVVASAHGARHDDRSAQRAEREQRRATRAEERATRVQERRAGREQERAARKATREEERAARRSARRGGVVEQATEQGPTESGAPGGDEKEAGAPVEPTAPAQPASPSDAELKKCSATIESTSSRITAGETVTIFGKLTCPAGVSVGERQITVSQGRQGTPTADFTVLGVPTARTRSSRRRSTRTPRSACSSATTARAQS